MREKIVPFCLFLAALLIQACAPPTIVGVATNGVSVPGFTTAFAYFENTCPGDSALSEVVFSKTGRGETVLTGFTSDNPQYTFCNASGTLYQPNDQIVLPAKPAKCYIKYKPTALAHDQANLHYQIQGVWHRIKVFSCTRYLKGEVGLRGPVAISRKTNCRDSLLIYLACRDENSQAIVREPAQDHPPHYPRYLTNLHCSVNISALKPGTYSLESYDEFILANWTLVVTE